MKQVYLNEYNLPADNNAIFFPYSTGLIQAYAQQFDVVKDHYEFKPTIFVRDTVKNIVNQYDNPDIVGFSTVIWNYRLSLAVAKELKNRFPSCLIIFGGPQVERDSTKFFKKHPYVDLCVYGEGEKIFKDVLIDRLILSSNIKSSHHKVLHSKDLEQDLDIFPSPYTSETFDNLIEIHPEIRFKGLVETNRNCPFQCAYCFWGQPELGRRVKHHSLDYIQQDAEWFGKNKTEYLFCTDANFGMFKRDIQTAETYSQVKQQHNYPKIFRVCYGKNSTDTIFRTASTLAQSGLAKLVTLSVQSQNKKTLEAIGRKNIKQETFEKLQKQYDKEGISTYTEIILGLPNETKQSFFDGIESTLRTIGDNQIFVYHCQVFKNTKLNSKEYRKQYKLTTVNRQLNEPHSEVRSDEMIKEFEEVIIGTSTLSVKDWIECAVLSWTAQLFHSMGVGQKTIQWLVSHCGLSHIDIFSCLMYSGIPEIERFWEIAQEITEGKPESQVDQRFGNMNYEPEEMAYLNICCRKESFYQDLLKEIRFLFLCHTLPYSPKITTLLKKDMKNIPIPTNNLSEFAVKTIIYSGKDNK